MTFEDWIAAQPTVFPMRIDYRSTPYQNPLIGEDPVHTCINVRQIIAIIIHMTNPNEVLKPTLSLNSEVVWGLTHILECASGALVFEERFRLDSRLLRKNMPAHNDAKPDSTQKENTDPAQPQEIPSHTYHIFYKKPDGGEKHIGKVQASTIELALAKARKTHSAITKKGGAIFVKVDPFDKGEP